MMPTDRFDRRLPELLEELSQPRSPDWFDEFVGLTARTRQRPAWTLPERWLPMTEIARPPVLAPRLPLRSMAIGLLIVTLLIASALAFVTSRRQALPDPFGLASTGLVAFDRGGDIYVADPKDGTERAIVTGPLYEIGPVWSLDGTRLAYEQRADAATRIGHIVVADADGRNAHVITPDPISEIGWYAFSPDGQQLLIAAASDYLARADGSGIREIGTGHLAGDATWGPDGREILFVGSESDGRSGTGIYAIDAATGVERTIRERTDDIFQGTPQWSPDGTRLAFAEWHDAPQWTVQVHVVRADGSGDTIVPLNGAVWTDLGAWSNDGQRLAIVRGTTTQGERFHAAIVRADGTDAGVDVDLGDDVNVRCCESLTWAPDDSFIAGTTQDASGSPLQQVVIDPASGHATPAPWSTSSHASIQRLAP
jgi:Tol biopolymer transport system component